MFQKEDLLKMLEDPDVINKIKSITSIPNNDSINAKSDIDMLTKKINVLNAEIDALTLNNKKYKKIINTQEQQYNEKIASQQHTINHLNQEITRLDCENSQLSQEISQLNQLLINEQKLSKNIKKSDELYNRFLKLNENIRILGLGNVISTKNVLSFMISCSNFDNLSSIWDYCKNMLQNDNYNINEINVIKDIFEYYFEETNNTFSIAKYKLDNTICGQEFDDELHIRGKGSRVSGNITEVLLNGYVQISNGKRVKQSIVIV